MNFREAESYLYSLGNEVETMKLGLENITTLLAALGNPQNKYKKVQVAGTNGKGSVCAFLDSICREAGIRAGLYTSPHLVSIAERIKIEGVDISEEDFARFATRVRETSEWLVSEGKLERVPTFFEQVTAIALLAFAEYDVELAVLETGLGGRYDAVTAAKAEIAVITRIDLDHQEYLGDTIEQIAAEKAAIIRPDSVVCIGRQSSTAFGVLKERCYEVGVTPKTLEYARFGPDSPGAGFNMAGFRAGEIMLSLNGEHQIENAALAVLIFKQLPNAANVELETIARGLETANHPGRLEYMDLNGCRILLDGAHNSAGIRALVSFLQEREPDSQILLVFGAMRDKDYHSMLSALLPLASDIILTQPSNARSVGTDELFELIDAIRDGKDVFAVPPVDQALDAAVQIVQTCSARWRPLVVVTGSLYLVGEARKAILSDATI